ncbi:hypothetical protein F2Q69_00042882 [Brassica cretica]|uniref:Uncharacterized protein n=1 Tax=Brassica cretica TaxID=69181 RepID=A0A8S9NIV3_BRACR|nr:hypothetical protein F2Q69_00042882 [Brassica cretica]
MNCPGAKGGSVQVKSSPVQSRRPLGFGQVLSDQPAASRLEHLCKSCGISEDARILAKRQILGSRIKVFDTMPRDVRDQCAEFRARPRFTPGFRGCDD